MVQIKKIKQSEAMNMISNSKGRYLSVKFNKRSTGEPRTISGRIGVKKNVKGVGLSYNLKEKGLWTIWDNQDRIHKSIPQEIVELKINKEHFIVEEKEVMNA